MRLPRLDLYIYVVVIFDKFDRQFVVCLILKLDVLVTIGEVALSRMVVQLILDGGK